DDDDSRFLLSEVLRRIGCEVTAAAGATEAESATATGDFDVAVIDIRLPGSTGVDVGRRLREEASRRARRIVLVATSASVLADERAGYLASGFDAFLA